MISIIASNAAWCYGRNGHRHPTRFDAKHPPLKWSRRWCEDPPVGTINLDGGRNPEIHIGNGEWQPLDDITNP